MSDARRPPILGTQVREEVGRGAEILYVPVISEDRNRLEWAVHIALPGCEPQPVYVSKTAKPKMLKTADAVLSYNRDLFPHSDGVFIPGPPHKSVDTDGSDTE